MNFIHMSDFEKFKEELSSKEKCYSSLTDEKLLTKNMKMFLMFGKKFWKENNESFLKCEILLLADVFEKFRKNSLRNYGLSKSSF